jgi:hypothetical protein
LAIASSRPTNSESQMNETSYSPTHIRWALDEVWSGCSTQSGVAFVPVVFFMFRVIA